MNRKTKKKTQVPTKDPNQQLQAGIRLQSMGKLEEARLVFSELVRKFPKEKSLHNRLGQVTFALGELENAAEHFKAALVCDPQQADTIANLGVVYRRLQQPDNAMECQKKAIALNPNNANAYNNLGILLLESSSQYQEAIDAFDRAILLKPDSNDAHFNKGNVYKKLGNFNKAIICYQEAVRLNPEYGAAYTNMAICYGALKDYPRSIECYEKALGLGVDINFVKGQYIFTKLHVGDWPKLDGLLDNLRTEILAGKPVAAPFATLALLDEPDVQRRAIETFMGIEFPPRTTPKVLPHPEHTRIRVGYFSSDYWNHPVAHLMLGLFAAHDRARFEVIAFSFGNPVKDKWHERVKNTCDQFIEVGHMSDREVAELARQMEIDIAVDLNGYTENCRAGIFAYRAAPVQVSYIGYLGTMAAPYIDYLVTDTTIVPPEAREFYSEKMIYLPSYQCNDPDQEPSDRPMSRAEFGLPENAFVYCAFNNNYKITPEVFESWMRILERVPHGVLWLYVNNEKAQANIKHAAANHGIQPDRLIFAKKISLEDHLARQRLGDLFLDTLPYNAGATASNALRVGLPVLTRTGKSFAGRMGSSLLKAVGLPDLIASTVKQYEDRAVELAMNPDFLATIRQKLKENLPSSALFDNARFARTIETAYSTVHQRACENKPPMHVLVR